MLYCIIMLRSIFSAWEQVRDDAIELINILLNELWNIAYADGPQHCVIFILVRVLFSERARGQNDRLDCSHTIVVVTLCGELFTRKLQ